jgi:hypothetical protein
MPAQAVISAMPQLQRQRNNFKDKESVSRLPEGIYLINRVHYRAGCAAR